VRAIWVIQAGSHRVISRRSHRRISCDPIGAYRDAFGGSCLRSLVLVLPRPLAPVAAARVVARARARVVAHARGGSWAPVGPSRPRSAPVTLVGARGGSWAPVGPSRPRSAPVTLVGARGGSWAPVGPSRPRSAPVTLVGARGGSWAPVGPSRPRSAPVTLVGARVPRTVARGTPLSSRKDRGPEPRQPPEN